MRKSIIVFLVLTIVGLFFASCKFDTVTYCYNCGSSKIEANDKVVINGQEYKIYKCQTCHSSYIIVEKG